MIDRDLAETIVALALILACALTAIASAQPRKDRPPRGKRAPRTRVRTKRRRVETTETVRAFAATEFPAPATGRPRPRILTGEPAAPEPSRPPARRAIALIGGITALAAGGAVGLLVVVRALVAMFKKIGG